MVVYARRIIVERDPIRGNPNDTRILTEGCSDKCAFLEREKVGTFTSYQCSLFRGEGTGEKAELLTDNGIPLALTECIRELCLEGD